MRVVLDTNILVSALWWEGNERAALLATLSEGIDLLLSDDILSEFLMVIEKEKFVGFPRDRVSQFIEILLETAILVETTANIAAIKDDPEDNRILECAVEGDADCIVSGDSHLIQLKEYKGVRIMNAREFIKVL